MKNKKKKSSAEPVKGTESKSLFPHKVRTNGHVLTAEARAFLKEALPNKVAQNETWHAAQILDFWSKPYEDLCAMFKQHQCDRGLEGRVLDIAREDIQRLLQIIYKKEK